MALNTPYDFDKDPPTATGEKLVSVANPLNAATGQTTYRLARRFTFTEGTYTFIVEADDAATFWLGTSQLESRMIASCVLGTPGINTLYIPQGEYRLDVILQNIPVAPTPCYFTLLIIRQGGEVVYASNKDGWYWDTLAISDDDLPDSEDVRFKLPVWSILPNWQNGITERLSWRTDVMESETGAEQRRSVRRNARRSFEASFLRQNQQRSRIDAFLTGIGSSQFMVPLWHEQVSLIDGVDMEASGVALENMNLREFRKGDLVLVTNGDPDDYDVLQVGDVEAARFSWAFPPPRSWPVGTRIYPMRQASIVSQPARMSNITESVAEAQILFELVEPYYVDASWGSSLNADPLFGFTIDRANQIDVDYTRKAFTIDNDSGKVDVVDHGKYTRTTSAVKLRLFGRSEAYRLRQFLQAARGRAQKFMCPTFMADVFPIGDIAAGDELMIRNEGFRAAMAVPQPVRIQLAFQFHNAPTLYRTITDAHTIYNGLRATGEKLMLDEALPSIKLSELKRISFVCETRFDQDDFEIHHPSSHQVVIDALLTLRQFKDKRIAQ